MGSQASLRIALQSQNGLKHLEHEVYAFHFVACISKQQITGATMLY